MQDIKAAIRWLRANAEEYALKTDRIVVVDESAGGHLSAMLGSSGGIAEFDDPALGNAKESSNVQVVVVKRNRPILVKKALFPIDQL